MKTSKFLTLLGCLLATFSLHCAGDDAPDSSQRTPDAVQTRTLQSAEDGANIMVIWPESPAPGAGSGGEAAPSKASDVIPPEIYGGSKADAPSEVIPPEANGGPDAVAKPSDDVIPPEANGGPDAAEPSTDTAGESPSGEQTFCCLETNNGCGGVYYSKGQCFRSGCGIGDCVPTAWFE